MGFIITIALLAAAVFLVIRSRRKAKAAANTAPYGVSFTDTDTDTEAPVVMNEDRESVLELTEPVEDTKPLDKMTVAELKTYAATNGIELGAARLKKDILSTIKKAKK